MQMKHCSLFFVFTFFLSAQQTRAAVDAYFDLSRDNSNLAEVVAHISSLDEDKNSLLWQLHKHIEDGHTIAPKHVVVEALVYAEDVVAKKSNQLSKDQLDSINDSLDQLASGIQNNDFAARLSSFNECAPSCSVDCHQIPACKVEVIRGPRGYRGPRGHHGATGPTGATGATGGAGLNELFFTAPMLVGCGEGPEIPSPSFLLPYDGCIGVNVWAMDYSTDQAPGNFRAGGTFNVPDDLDNTKPVTMVVHLLVATSLAAAGNANLQVNMAYVANNALGGVLFPAPGYSDTQISGDFAVTPPSANPSNTNIRQISVSIPLDAALLVSGDWAYMLVTRIAPSTNEFEDFIWLSTISIQYSRLT